MEPSELIEFLKEVWKNNPGAMIAAIATIFAAFITGFFSLIGKFKKKSEIKVENEHDPPRVSQEQVTVGGDQTIIQNSKDVKLDQHKDNSIHVNESKHTHIEKQYIINKTTSPQKTSEETLRPPTPYLAHPYPLQENFTGRKEERGILSKWFEKDKEPMLVMIAIGGMGKSSLSWVWLQEDILKAGKDPEGVIWWSFYEKNAGFDSFLNRTITYVSAGKVDPKSFESTYDKREYLNNQLSNRRFLLILDGVERVLRAYASLSAPYQGDEVKEDERGDFRSCPNPNMGIFLKNLASGYPQTKTLITSRLFPRELDRLDGCQRYDLLKLSTDDAVNLFHNEGIKGTHTEIERVCAPLGYHPLSLRLLIGMLKEDPEYKGKIEHAHKIDIIAEGPKSDLKEGEKLAHLLTHIYDRLPEEEQTLLSQLAAFRNPLDYETLKIFQGESNEKEFKNLIKKLEKRGLIFLDSSSQRYDLHPIVRKYAYGRLIDKKATHNRLLDYFENVPTPEKVESLEDLNPVIERYHHTLNAGRYDEAVQLLYERLRIHLDYDFGAYQLYIELLLALFPDGEDKPPRLKKKDVQAWTLNELAISYGLSGQPSHSVPLIKRENELKEKADYKQDLAIGLANLAIAQMSLGELKVAETNLLRSIEICREIVNKIDVAIGHQELGRLHAYQGEFEQAKREIALSTKYWKKTNNQQGLCMDESYRSLAAILQGDYTSALEAAQKARELADVEHYERDIIQAEWLLGAAYRGLGNLTEAETHLQEALARCRKINMVDHEADILLELARLSRDQAGRQSEAKNLASEAIEIADRSQYRLKQADIHLFLAQLALDEGDKAKARTEAEIAKERTSCGYKPTFDKAEQFLASL